MYLFELLNCSIRSVMKKYKKISFNEFKLNLIRWKSWRRRSLQRTCTGLVNTRDAILKVHGSRVAWLRAEEQVIANYASYMDMDISYGNTSSHKSSQSSRKEHLCRRCSRLIGELFRWSICSKGQLETKFYFFLFFHGDRNWRKPFDLDQVFAGGS